LVVDTGSVGCVYAAVWGAYELMKAIRANSYGVSFILMVPSSIDS